MAEIAAAVEGGGIAEDDLVIAVGARADFLDFVEVDEGGATDL